jgi:hypothetical protein
VAQPLSPVHITLVPNPAASSVVVSWNSTGYVFTNKPMITITDLYGKKLIEQPFSANYLLGQDLVDVSRLPAGIYIVTVWDGEKQKAVSKLLKQ